MDVCLLGAVRSPMGLDGRPKKSGTVQGLAICHHILNATRVPLQKAHTTDTRTHKYRLIAEILIVHLLRRLPCPTGKLHWVGIYRACSKLVFNLQAYVAALQAHRHTNSIDQKRWRHIQRYFHRPISDKPQVLLSTSFTLFTAVTVDAYSHTQATTKADDVQRESKK